MLTINDLHGSRFQAALEFLQEGSSFQYQGISFQLLGEAQLECQVESSWLLANVTDETARADFERARALLDTLLEDERFSVIVGARSPLFVLLCGCDKGWVPVCHLDGDTLKWTESVGP